MKWPYCLFIADTQCIVSDRTSDRGPGVRGRQFTLYVTARVQSPVTVFSSSRRGNVLLPRKRQKEGPSKTVVGVEVRLYSFLNLCTVSLTECKSGTIQKLSIRS
jgi:hypothetical protein